MQHKRFSQIKHVSNPSEYLARKLLQRNLKRAHWLRLLQQHKAKNMQALQHQQQDGKVSRATQHAAALSFAAMLGKEYALAVCMMPEALITSLIL
jgi:hypothetical protein